MTASKDAKTIAVSPPKIKNVKKIAASEKLIAKFERGIIKLNLVLTARVKTKRAIKPELIMFVSRLKAADAKHALPNATVATLKNLDIFSRFINGKLGADNLEVFVSRFLLMKFFPNSTKLQ